MSEASKQEFTFQAEIKQLLQLLAHSLYQSKEIAIRELISNAADALSKRRYVGLADEKFREMGELEISIERDTNANQLTIRDNGIGMSREEMIENLGTIAHSGSLDFLKNMTGEAKKDVAMIGRFGVGFYSAFMIADKVTVRSRGYNQDQGWEWESDGTGSFSVTEADGLEPGTSIVLHIKDESKDLLQEYWIKNAIRRYSGFVPYPIKLGTEILNTQKPIWVEPKNKLTEEQYAAFYQYLTHRSDEKPLWHLHISTDSPIQFHSIVYCPAFSRDFLTTIRAEDGLQLHAKRVLVQEKCPDVLPDWARFLVGVVDSEDLPLNVSRETLQDSLVLKKIRDVISKKVIDKLQQVATETPEDYLKFYRLFGDYIKLGATNDYEHREKLSKLLRFHSTAIEQADGLTSLEEYVKRCQESQKQIYFLFGPDLSSVRRNPHLEGFRKRNIEVLLITQPFDEMCFGMLREFDGKKIVSIDSAEIEMPEQSILEPEKKPDEQLPPGFGKVISLIRDALGDSVTDVKESKRLIDSPCCLVSADSEVSLQMQKILKMADSEYKVSKKIFEINPNSTLIRRLADLSANEENDGFIKEVGRQLYSNAMLLEGVCPDPVEAVSRMQSFIEQAAAKRSVIVQA